METARRSISVTLPPQAAYDRWLQFTGQTQRPEVTRAGTSADELPDEVEKGRVYFADEAGASRVTMELRYNPRAVKEAGLTDDWVSQRVALYLRRFKEQAER